MPMFTLILDPPVGGYIPPADDLFDSDYDSEFRRRSCHLLTVPNSPKCEVLTAKSPVAVAVAVAARMEGTKRPLSRLGYSASMKILRKHELEHDREARDKADEQLVLLSPHYRHRRARSEYFDRRSHFHHRHHYQYYPNHDRSALI